MTPSCDRELAAPLPLAGEGAHLIRGRTSNSLEGSSMKRVWMDRFIDAIEWIAAGFVGIVALDIFL